METERLTQRAAVFFISSFLLFPVLALAAEEPQVRNLRAISVLQLVVERPTADAREAGITEEAVGNQVAAHFRNFLPQVSLDGKESPALYVRIILHKRKKEDLYYGMISLQVDRPVVILSPQGDFPALSQVWENTVVFSGKDPLPGTYEILARLLTLLIGDYKKANP